MLNVLSCIAYEHDLRLVALSALICVLGCFTTTILLSRSCASRGHVRRWLGFAAVTFGCSVWSLHFVAMLAFVSAHDLVYDFSLTAWSAVVASAGALAGFLVWRAAPEKFLASLFGGILLGLAVTGMHYIGVAAMTASALITYDPVYVAASVGLSMVFFVIALMRAVDLRLLWRRLEIAGWLALAICGLHFTGMTAVTVMPVAADTTRSGVLGTIMLAIAVGSVSVAILIASLAATMVEQHLSNRALQELSRMRLMSNVAREVILIYRHGVVLEVNSAGERLFKAPASDIVGRPIASLFTSESAPAFNRSGYEATARRQQEELEVRAIDGTRVPVELTSQPIEYLGRTATVAALLDLTNRKRDQARIQHLARYDALTSLPNRYTLLERLGVALDAAAQQGSALAVVYIDLDRFKPVNDLHGHAAGDALLVQASNRMLAEVQPADTVARIGGDEFVMVLAIELQPEKASAIATRTIEALRKPFQVEGRSIEIGASAGIALYPDDGATADTLMRAADAAMYRVKEDGRGAIRFYEPSMNAHLQARLQLEQELAGAIERNELMLHYQPIINGVTGKLEMFEALIRWNHPRRGTVPPLDFISLAEDSGLINQVGRWVIDTACREAASWTDPLPIAVNVSPRQFHQSDLCDIIRMALGRHALDPRRLVVEVTEGILIDDAAKAVGILNQLREMGVRVALDDFGTGYSSLSYLQLFKFDKFKIDKSFVRRLGESEDALTLTRSIINLGHNLGLHVTAEGVENPAQLAILRNLGCDDIQGYLVAKPAPFEAFTSSDQLRVAALFKEDHLRLLG